MKKFLIAPSRLFALTVLTAAGLLSVSCEREGNGKKDDDRNFVSLQMASGNTQQGRIKSIDFAKQAKLPKRQRLTYVATITAPLERKDLSWSASSVAVRNDNSAERNLVYITWHSNRQATDPATAWGGALDLVDMTGTPELEATYFSDELKFNHVLVADQRLFLSSASSRTGGTVARAETDESGTIVGSASVACIGFPGSSVNAVTRYNAGMLAVSGHNGTYATFPANIEPQKYNYLHPEKNTIKPLNEAFGNFGGKYAISNAANDKAYVLHDAGEGGVIIPMDGNEIQVGKTLTSSAKVAEIYDAETKQWTLSGTPANHYGKHTMAVTDKYAYVACGYNGLKGIDLTSGSTVFEKNLATIGLCIEGNFLYAATSMGLRVYEIQENGDLTLYAFEVESYDENTGAPASDYAATTGTEKRHSPNFVAVDAQTGYIYIAYGQSGVRVYKLVKDTENPDTPVPGINMGGDIVWAEENLEGYYAWGEIFHGESVEGPADEAGLSFTYDGLTFKNDASYYTHAGTSKINYTYDNYRFFANSAKLAKYQLAATWPTSSEDGLSTLEPMDDAAAVRLGQGWRMPTKEECQALIASCQVAEGEKDGKQGLILTAPNGNTLFLPRTGYYNDRGHRDASGYYYWTSSLNASKKRNADTRKEMPGGFITWGEGRREWCSESLADMIDFYYGFNVNGYDRSFGMKIRPVKDK